MEKQKSTQDGLKRQPSIRSKTAAPVVRQTLTSYKRMLNANPLLQLENAGIKIDELLKNKSVNIKLASNSIQSISKNNSVKADGKVSIGFKKPVDVNIKKSQNLSAITANVVPNKIKIISGNRPLVNGDSKQRTTKTKENSVNKNDQALKNFTKVKSKVNSFHKPSVVRATNTNPTQKSNPVTGKCKLRRSLSSDYLQIKKGKLHDRHGTDKKSNLSCSENNLYRKTQVAENKEFCTIKEESSETPFVFKTPSAHERRSICRFTPMSAMKRSSLFDSSTPFLVGTDKLQERLNKWLKSRGRKLSSFKHLSCFGINHAKKTEQDNLIDMENKENVEIVENKSASYENLQITPQKQECDIDNVMPTKDMGEVAKEALVELQNLVDEDYPTLQCLGWLELIREKYKKIDEQPEFWECRAAIEQSAGNVGNAVEYYKTAIVQGAEVQTVDKSLDLLLKKFSLLNISPNNSEITKIDKDKQRIIKEARNVFKSTIIQFAVQERKLKKNQEIPTEIKFVATPVRRSTRLSRSGYVSTPGVQLCMSLREIEPDRNIDFQTNKALC